VAIEFLSDDQVAAYGRFVGPPEHAELERFFFLQLGIADASSVKRYAERQSTQWEHAAEIRQAYGYRDFTDDGPQEEIRAFIAARAWTRTEGPRALFDQSVAWLRERKILLPGPSVLARLVSEVRTAESDRLHGVMASAAAQADAGLPGRLVGLLDVPDGSRVSEMERLRCRRTGWRPWPGTGWEPRPPRCAG
jgi:Domain of unknown function (DUF4158)